MATHANGTATNGIPPKITLYTNHNCPWAHRAHIVLNELALLYDEVIIDLSTPREASYLKINPRGLVPSIKFSNSVINDIIITESAVVAQFLADSFPSHLLPASHSSPTAPLIRAKTAFFVDAWFSKCYGKLLEALRAESMEEKAKVVRELVVSVEKEIEPLLVDKGEGGGEFFLGAEKMTLADALVAPFVLRLHAYARAGMLHSSLEEELQKLPNYWRWQKAVTSQESVLYVWDEENVTKKTKERIEKIKAGAN